MIKFFKLFKFVISFPSSKSSSNCSLYSTNFWYLLVEFFIKLLRVFEKIFSIKSLRLLRALFPLSTASKILLMACSAASKESLSDSI